MEKKIKKSTKSTKTISKKSKVVKKESVKKEPIKKTQVKKENSVHSKRKLSGKPVSKKQLKQIIDFFTKNPNNQLYVNEYVGSSLYRILAVKDSKYFLNIDDFYIIYDSQKGTALSYGLMYDSPIQCVNDIPWEN